MRTVSLVYLKLSAAHFKSSSSYLIQSASPPLSLQNLLGRQGHRDSDTTFPSLLPSLELYGEKGKGNSTVPSWRIGWGAVDFSLWFLLFFLPTPLSCWSRFHAAGSRCWTLMEHMYGFFEGLHRTWALSICLLWEVPPRELNAATLYGIPSILIDQQWDICHTQWWECHSFSQAHLLSPASFSIPWSSRCPENPSPHPQLP